MRKLQIERRPTPPHQSPALNSCRAAVDTVLWREQKGSRIPWRDTATSMPEATSKGDRSNNEVASLSNQRKRAASTDYFWKQLRPDRLRGSYWNFLTANGKNQPGYHQQNFSGTYAQPAFNGRISRPHRLAFLQFAGTLRVHQLAHPGGSQPRDTAAFPVPDSRGHSTSVSDRRRAAL